MCKSNFIEPQTTRIWHQVAGRADMEEVCRKIGISQQTFYRSHSEYDGLVPSDLKRPNRLEEE